MGFDVSYYASVLEVRPGNQDEYKERYDEIWPEMLDASFRVAVMRGLKGMATTATSGSSGTGRAIAMGLAEEQRIVGDPIDRYRNRDAGIVDQDVTAAMLTGAVGDEVSLISST